MALNNVSLFYLDANGDPVEVSAATPLPTSGGGGGGGGDVTSSDLTAAIEAAATTEALATFSSAGNTNVTAPAGSNYHTATVSAGAGSGTYTRVIPLLATNSPTEGSVVNVVVNLPASANPTIEIRDASPSGTLLLTITNSGGTADTAVGTFLYTAGAYINVTRAVTSSSSGSTTETWSTTSGTSPAVTFAATKGNVIIPLSGDTTISASGYAQGRQLDLFIKADASLRAVTFPAWRPSGSAAPSSLAANTGLLVRLKCEDNTAANCWAEYIPFAASSVLDPSASYVTNSSDTSDASTYTFTSQSIGSADSTRQVVVAVIGRIAGNTTLAASSMTIAGVSASEVVGKTTIDNTTNSGYVGLWKASVPTGTTGTIVVNFNATAVRCNIAIFSLLNSSTTSTTNTFGDGTSGTSISINTNVANKGVVIAAAMWAGSTSTATWTGITRSYDTQVGAETAHVSGGLYTASASETPRTISATISLASTGRCAVVGVFT